MQARTSTSRSTAAPPAATGATAARDPSRGRGNAALQELLRGKRGLELEASAGAPAPDVQGTAKELSLAGGGDLLFATATNAKNLAADQNSYTTALLAIQRENPEWTLAECVRHANAQDVNGLGSQLALTGEAEREKGRGVGYKQALVIGNGDYANFGDLEGAARDAASMAEVYGQRGYEVDHQENLGGAEMASELRGVGKELGEGDELLLYYAGHGYTKGLLGVDAAKGLKSGIVANAEVIGAANRLRGQGVKTEVVLDACQTGAAADDLQAREEIDVGLEGLKEGLPTPGVDTVRPGTDAATGAPIA